MAKQGLDPFRLGITWKPVRERQRKSHQVKDNGKGCAAFSQSSQEAFLQAPIEKTGPSLCAESVPMLLGATGRGNLCRYPPGTNRPNKQLEERRLSGSYHLFPCTFGLQTKSSRSRLTGDPVLKYYPAELPSGMLF